MRQFFSTILSQIYSRKKIILGGLAIAMLFSFVPFQIAQAGLTGIIVGAILNVLNLGLTAILIPIAALVELVFKADSALLAVIISGLAGMTVTPGLATTPSFVLEGWRISQNLVNIVFILILTFIGLATILRLQTYQLQKTLPSLIIIALLVNFSGLLVGFVTDIGNILTKVFIGKGLFSGDLLGFTFTLSPAGNVAKILFYFIAILILFIIALMFIVRMVILWMLVILAPLAFGAYILPATKKYWTQWFGALIQWSLFTIPIAFFMYLARLILQDKVFDWSSLGFFSGAFPPITALILLFLGITLSMQMAPAGAQGIINMGKKAGMGAAKWTGQKAWKATRDRIPEGARKAMERMATGENPTWGKGKTGLGGFLQRGAAGVTGYARRTAGGVAKSTVIGTEQADAEKAKAKALKQDVITNMKDLRQTASVAERTAIMDAMRQKNQIKDALNPDIIGKENVLKQDEVMGVYEKAHKTRNSDLMEGLERAFVNQDWKDENGNAVELKDALGNRIEEKDAAGNTKLDASGNIIYKKRKVVDELADITDRMTVSALDPNDRTQKGLDRKDREERGYTSFGEKVIGEAKTADEIKALQKNWWNNDDLMNAAHKFWGGSQTGQAATNFGRDFVNRLEATKKDADWYFELEERKGSDGTVTYAPRNIAMPRYEASSAAQGLGIAPKEGAERTEQINDMARFANALVKIRDKTVRDEVATIAKDIQNINDRRDIVDVLGANPSLRTMFHGMHQDDQVKVARALADIKDSGVRADVATYLSKNPQLSNVADTLAFTRDPAARANVASALAAIPQDNIRSGVAGVLRREPALAEGVEMLHAVKDFENKVAEGKSRLQSAQAKLQEQKALEAQEKAAGRDVTKIIAGINNLTTQISTTTREVQDAQIVLTKGAGVLSQWVTTSVAKSPRSNIRQPLWKEIETIEKRSPKGQGGGGRGRNKRRRP